MFGKPLQINYKYVWNS